MVAYSQDNIWAVPSGVRHIGGTRKEAEPAGLADTREKSDVSRTGRGLFGAVAGSDEGAPDDARNEAGRCRPHKFHEMRLADEDDIRGGSAAGLRVLSGAGGWVGDVGADC